MQVHAVTSVFISFLRARSHPASSSWAKISLKPVGVLLCLTNKVFEKEFNACGSEKLIVEASGLSCRQVMSSSSFQAWVQICQQPLQLFQPFCVKMRVAIHPHKKEKKRDGGRLKRNNAFQNERQKINIGLCISLTQDVDHQSGSELQTCRLALKNCCDIGCQFF